MYTEFTIKTADFAQELQQLEPQQALQAQQLEQLSHEKSAAWDISEAEHVPPKSPIYLDIKGESVDDDDIDNYMSDNGGKKRKRQSKRKSKRKSKRQSKRQSKIKSKIKSKSKRQKASAK
jgi:hypothetical protein